MIGLRIKDKKDHVSFTPRVDTEKARLVVKFPEKIPFETIKYKLNREEGKHEKKRIAGGTLLQWDITNPAMGERYRIELWLTKPVRGTSK